MIIESVQKDPQAVKYWKESYIRLEMWKEARSHRPLEYFKEQQEAVEGFQTSV